MALKFEDMLEQLGDQGRRAVMDTYALLEQGLIDRATFLAVTSDLLQHINERGSVYGQLSYQQVRSILLDAAPEISTAPAPIVSTRPAKISESLATILDGDQDEIERRLERLGYVLPMESTHGGYAAALQRDPVATGWQRGLDAGACELCQWWARDGRVWPKDHPMPTHKGCKCQQIPAVGDVAPTEYTAKRQRSEQAIANRDRRSAQVRSLIQQGELTA